VQDIILHDAISKRAAVFFQLSSGLSTLGLLDIIKCFPNIFEEYFVYNEIEELSAEMFRDALTLPRNPTNEECRVISMLHEFMESCTPLGQIIGLRIGTRQLCSNFYLLCYAVLLKNFAHYVQIMLTIYSSIPMLCLLLVSI